MNQVIKGYENLGIDLWLSPRSYHVLVEVCYEGLQPGADDVIELLRDKWQAGLALSRPEYVTAISSTPQLAVHSLGEAVSMRSMADGSSLAVYSTNLCSAHQTVKARTCLHAACFECLHPCCRALAQAPNTNVMCLPGPACPLSAAAALLRGRRQLH